MTDPFTDVADELMTRATDLAGGDAPPPISTGARTKKHVCPYCGAVTAVVDKPPGPCPRCSMEDTPATRAATKARIGPWYVLQTRNPSAPGMKWATLLSLVSKGQVTPRSVVRGPTTHQLWKFAAHIKGLSREFNLCYSCDGEIERTANQCPNCDQLQEPPVNPDSLLESRDLSARTPIQREIKPNPAATTDLVLAGGQTELARTRTPDDGILSAKELAAAFQLDFNPQSPAAIEPAGPRAPRRPGRALAATALLALIAGGGVLAARPDYREKTLAWVSGTYSSVKNSIAPEKPAPKNMPWENTTAEKPADESSKTAAATEAPTHDDAQTAPAPPPTPAPAPSDQAQTPPPVHSPAPTEQVQTPAPAPAPAPTELAQTPSPAPAPVVTPVPPPDPAPVQVATPDPAPIEKPVVKPAPPVVVAKATSPQQQQQERFQKDLEASVPQSHDAQVKFGKQLRDDAFAAERIPDFPLAIKFYEKIQKELDQSAWPMNKGTLEGYLDYARRQVN